MADQGAHGLEQTGPGHLGIRRPQRGLEGRDPGDQGGQIFHQAAQSVQAGRPERGGHHGADNVGERPVRQHVVILGRRPGHVRAPRGAADRKLLEQPGLADPGLSGHHPDGRTADLGPLDQGEQSIHLVVPPPERQTVLVGRDPAFAGQLRGHHLGPGRGGQAESQAGELTPAPAARLVPDPVKVGPDGADADVELIGDGLVGEPLGDQGGDLGLAGAEPTPTVGCIRLSCNHGSPCPGPGGWAALSQ